MGDKKNSTGGATADRHTTTTGTQHKYDQTTAFWRGIQVVHSRPTQAKEAEGKEETGLDRRLPEWRNTSVRPGTGQSVSG